MNKPILEIFIGTVSDCSEKDEILRVQIANWIEDYADSPANDIAGEKVGLTILVRLLYMGKIYE